MPGRWADARQPNRKELAATLVLLAAAGRVVGEGQRRAAGRRGTTDLDLPVWAGVLPLHEAYGEPSAAPDLRGGRRCRPTSATGRDSDGAAPAYRSLSLWHDTADDDFAPRPALPADLDVDVADRRRRVHRAVDRLLPRGRRPVTADRGAGARGRRLRRQRTQRRLVLGAVPGIDRLAREAVRRAAGRSRSTARCRAPSTRSAGSPTAEGIDCHFAKGGTVVVARAPVQLDTGARARSPRRAGGASASEDLALLGPRRDARARLQAARTCSARRTRRTAPRSTRPGWCAAWPARWSGSGSSVHEQTPVTAIEPGGVVTPHGRCAPRSWSGRPRASPRSCPACVATLAPVYSLMIATEPLPDDVWDRIGLRDRETFTDHRHLIIYGQRTADGRLAFGGRGAPYHFGSGIRPEQDRDARRLRRAAPDPRRPAAGRRRRRRSPTPGAGRWASPATGAPRSGLDRATGLGLGRRVRRRRRLDHQPGRPDPCRPRPRPGLRPRAPALGQPPSRRGSRSRCAG